MPEQIKTRILDRGRPINIKPDSIWQHYKGGIYRVKGVAIPRFVDSTTAVWRCEAKHTERGYRIHVWELDGQLSYIRPGAWEKLVIYKSTKDFQVWARPLDMWNETLTIPRFKKC